MPFLDIQLNDGHKIPGIAYGSGSVNKYKDIHVYIEQAIEAGFSHLDTAQMYENEDSVGAAIRDSGLARSQLYVTTKCSKGDIPVRDSVTISLQKLGLKYLDLYLVHAPHLFPNYVQVWKELVQFRQEGLTKSIGVSNFAQEHLEALAEHSKAVPAVNQIELHLYNYSGLKDLLAYHAAHGIVTEGYGSLAPITKYPDGPVDKPLQDAADRLGITTTQVIFLWLRMKGIVIVTTSSNKQHLEQYYAVGDLPPLTTEEVNALEKAGAQGPPRQFFRGFRLFLILAPILYLFHLSTQACWTREY